VPAKPLKSDSMSDKAALVQTKEERDTIKKQIKDAMDTLEPSEGEEV
jgi:hypothetical protein